LIGMADGDCKIGPLTIRSCADLFKKTFANWVDINAPRLGAALSFYTMLSVAPLMVLCISLAGLIFGAQAARGQIEAQIASVIGPQGSEVIQSLLAQTSKPSSNIAAAAIGLVTLLFGASGVFLELRDSLNLVWGVKYSTGSGFKGMLRYRFYAFALVLGIGFLLLVSLLLSAAIAAVEKFFAQIVPIPGPLLHVINLLVSFVTITILFGLLYKVVPDVHIEWQDVWIGAAVTSLLFSIGKLLIGLYLGKASVGSAYGAAGSLVVFLVWVYYSAQIFLLGAEFTRMFAESRGSRAQSSRFQHGVAPLSPRLKQA
jgi:membrane protein